MECVTNSPGGQEPGPKGVPSQEQRLKANAKSGFVRTPLVLGLTTDPLFQADTGRRGVAVTSSSLWHPPRPALPHQCRAEKASDSIISTCAGRALPPKMGQGRGRTALDRGRGFRCRHSLSPELPMASRGGAGGLASSSEPHFAGRQRLCGGCSWLASSSAFRPAILPPSPPTVPAADT